MKKRFVLAIVSVFCIGVLAISVGCSSSSDGVETTTIPDYEGTWTVCAISTDGTEDGLVEGELFEQALESLDMTAAEYGTLVLNDDGTITMSIMGIDIIDDSTEATWTGTATTVEMEIAGTTISCAYDSTDNTISFSVPDSDGETLYFTK